MEKIKVLIADDSLIYRSQIRAALNDIEHVEILGAVANGRLAIATMGQAHYDLLILDLEMPEMDGMQTLTEIKRLGLKIKVILFSSTTKRAAEATFEALRLGASDFVAKPAAGVTGSAASSEQPSAKIKALMEPKIKALFSSHFAPRVSTTPAAVVVKGSYPQVLWDVLKPKVIVIGSSTGGPTVLEKVFSQLQGPLNCPILIAQHMPPVFTAALAERIAKVSGLNAKEAVHGEAVVKNQIYFAPGDYHMTIKGSILLPTICLDKGPLENYVRPAVDPLFKSAAQMYREKCLGIVFTGMGSDGKNGAIDIKQAGGAIIIQNKESCVVFGMPGAVFESGAFDKIYTPEEITTYLQDKISLSLHQPLSKVSGR